MIPLHAETGLLSNQHVELVVFFFIGLLGGAHCLGMCGPLVTMYSDRMTGGRDGALTLFEVRQHALFNVGRTLSYAVLGGLFGLAGSFLLGAAAYVTAAATLVHVVSGLVIGVVILFVGARYATGNLGGLHVGGRSFSRVYGFLTDRIDDRVDGVGIVSLGLVHGLLPCPLLYPAFLYAFVRASPATGVLALTTLGLGTIPAMFLYGTLIQSVDASTRTRLHRALGVAFLVLGWMPIAHSLASLGIYIPHLDPPIYQPLTP